MDTAEIIRHAKRGLAGKHPEHGFPMPNGAAEEGTGYALLALVAEQQATNAQLASIADSLARIADALEQPKAGTAPAPEVEPKRRLWLPARRRTGE